MSKPEKNAIELGTTFNIYSEISDELPWLFWGQV
jgi:hypothetical protein